MARSAKSKRDERALLLAEANCLELPPHPRGRAWKPRHILAAFLRARGKDWPDVAELIGAAVDTAKHYPARAEGWHLLLRHFRAMYVAELEDRLVPKALAAVEETLASRDEHARVRAAEAALRHHRESRKLAWEMLKAGSHEEEGGGGDVFVDTAMESEPEPPAAEPAGEVEPA